MKLRRYLGPALLVVLVVLARSAYVNRAALASRWADATGAYVLGKGWSGAAAAFLGLDR